MADLAHVNPKQLELTTLDGVEHGITVAFHCGFRLELCGSHSQPGPHCHEQRVWCNNEDCSTKFGAEVVEFNIWRLSGSLGLCKALLLPNLAVG